MYAQQPRLDYHETITHVARVDTLRCLITFASQMVGHYINLM